MLKITILEIIVPLRSKFDVFVTVKVGIMHDLQFIFRYNYSMNPSLQGKKALVIDNSSIITKIIKNFLVKSGFSKDNIFAAHDKNMAMMMFGLESFNLVTSGIHLKDSTGINLLKEIRKKIMTIKRKPLF